MASKQRHRATADRTLRHGYRTHRDAIWAAIRELRQFTINDIEEWVNDTARSKQANDARRCSRDTVKTYVQGLTLAGYLQRTEGQRRECDESNRYVQNRWQLIKDAGNETPRVTRKGERVTQGDGNERMWRAMRVLGEFNRTELLSIVNSTGEQVNETTAKDYIRYLHYANYLKEMQEGAPGRQARYRFIPQRYTGPLAPMIQRVKAVYDPNTREVVWSRQGGEA
ncbi:MAG: hypothetical protein OEZ16_07095 [Chromatiales bacterium]|nr:hypothetical protein [Chromatiales bacterium]